VDVDRCCATTGFPRPFAATGSRVLAPDFGAIAWPKVPWRTNTRPPSAWDIGVNGMLLQKVIERFRQLRNAIGLAILRCHTDIVHDHLTDALGPVDLMQQMIGKGRRENNRYAFVFGYCLDLRGVETGHCNASRQ
jgi:hypothetical protein